MQARCNAREPSKQCILEHKHCTNAAPQPCTCIMFHQVLVCQARSTVWPDAQLSQGLQACVHTNVIHLSNPDYSRTPGHLGQAAILQKETTLMAMHSVPQRNMMLCINFSKHLCITCCHNHPKLSVIQ